MRNNNINESDLKRKLEKLLIEFEFFNEIIHPAAQSMYPNYQKYVMKIYSSVESLLEKYHIFYDEYKKSYADIKWYSSPETLAMLTIRNCYHHFSRLRYLEEFYINNPARNVKCYLIDYYNYEELPKSKLFISYKDLLSYLESDYKTSRLSANNVEKILKYIQHGFTQEFLDYNNLNLNDVYINVLPIIINSMKKIIENIDKIFPEKSDIQKKYFEIFKNRKINMDDVIFKQSIYTELGIIDKYYFRKNKYAKNYKKTEMTKEKIEALKNLEIVI